MIDEKRVHEIFMNCLTGENVVLIEGVINDFGLDKNVLEKNREEITEMLRELPDEFKQSNPSGGWSFLEACRDINGNMWTSSHPRMEQLFVMGIGLGLVRLGFPRKLWSMLPGGMPYYTVEIRGIMVKMLVSIPDFVRSLPKNEEGDPEIPSIEWVYRFIVDLLRKEGKLDAEMIYRGYEYMLRVGSANVKFNDMVDLLNPEDTLISIVRELVDMLDNSGIYRAWLSYTDGYFLNINEINPADQTTGFEE